MMCLLPHAERAQQRLACNVAWVHRGVDAMSSQATEDQFEHRLKRFARVTRALEARRHTDTEFDRTLRGCEKIAYLLRSPSNARAGGASRPNLGHLAHQTPQIWAQRTLSRTLGDALATAVEIFTASKPAQARKYPGLRSAHHLHAGEWHAETSCPAHRLMHPTDPE